MDVSNTGHGKKENKDAGAGGNEVEEEVSPEGQKVNNQLRYM